MPGFFSSWAVGARLTWLVFWLLECFCSHTPEVGGGSLDAMLLGWCLLSGGCNLVASLQRETLQHDIRWVNIPSALAELAVAVLLLAAYLCAEDSLFALAWQLMLWGIPCVLLLNLAALILKAWLFDRRAGQAESPH